MTKNAKLAVSALGVVVVLALVAVLISRGRSTDATSAGTGTTGGSVTVLAPATSVLSPTGTADGTLPTVPGSDGTGTGSSGPTSEAAPTTPTTKAPPPTLPVQVSVSNTNGLQNGQTVKIRVVPTGGSKAFAFEAYQCRADATYRNDADIRPLQTGKCTPKPLSANADQRVEVVGQEPFQSLDGEFRVGVGAQTWNTVSNGPATLTCGPGNPCSLVLKLQYPDGFGFQAIPITFG